MLDSSSLTANAQKSRVFAHDPHLRDALDDLAKVSATRIDRLVHDTVPIIFRPDSLVSGHYRRIWSLLRQRGLRALYAIPFRYDRALVRECWRYQLNIATRQRIDVMDMILIGQPAAYVLFAREEATREGPLCTLVSSSKGPSDPVHRLPRHLRHSGTVAQASVLTFLHIPDEPLDLVRELGAFFSRSERSGIVRAVSGRDASDASLAMLDRIASSYEGHDLTTDRAWRQLFETAAVDARPQVAALRDKWQAQRGHWRRILARLGAVHPKAAHWDLVAIAAGSATSHVAGGVPTVADEVRIEQT